jgi:hypothetical protein
VDRQLELAKGLAFNDMSARRSFQRSMGKYEPQTVKKPVATLTAWRGRLTDPGGQPYPEKETRRRNEAANKKLAAMLRMRGLSHYPVVGAGQETVLGVQMVNKEGSFIVQPQGIMPEGDFLDHIRELLFNPTGEAGGGPFAHTQYGAIVKLPSDPQAHLLHHPDGMTPTGPQDYTEMVALGDAAARRLQQEPYYTQMRYGPRADLGMMDHLDRPGDVGNPRPGTGKPGAGLPGKRFTIKDRPRP